MDDSQAQLIAEQLGRLRDSIFSRLDQLEERLNHHKELEAEQVQSIRKELAELRETTKDHEARLRANTDGVTRFQVWTSLASGGGLVTGLGAIIKSFLP